MPTGPRRSLSQPPIPTTSSVAGAEFPMSDGARISAQEDGGARRWRLAGPASLLGAVAGFSAMVVMPLAGAVVLLVVGLAVVVTRQERGAPLSQSRRLVSYALMTFALVVGLYMALAVIRS